MIKKTLSGFFLIFMIAMTIVYFGIKEEDEPLPELVTLYPVPNAIKEYFEPEEKFYIVNFFASWCKTCIDEMPAILAISQTTQVSFYGIALNDFSERVDEILGKWRLPYKKIALDFPHAPIKEMKLHRIPRILIIYKDNVIFDYEGKINGRILDKKIFPIINRIKQTLESER